MKSQARRAAFIVRATNYLDDSCLPWPFSKTGAGYPVVGLHGPQHYVHRLICEAANGAPAPPRTDVAHSCGRPECLNPRHLRWATHGENMSDKNIHGTIARGTRQGLARLTESKVRWLRTQQHRRVAEVAAELGVSRGAVYDVWSNKTWAWLT